MSETLIRRLWVRHYGYRRFQGIRGPAGTKFFSFEGNMRGFTLAARHPRWSITWLWFVRVAPGFYGDQKHWRRRFGLVIAPYLAFKSCPIVVNFGWFHAALHMQDAMPNRPGRQHYSRKHWNAHVHKLASIKGEVARAAAYRAEVARMNDAVPEDCR